MDFLFKRRKTVGHKTKAINTHHNIVAAALSSYQDRIGVWVTAY
jgi:hypothetical protein